MVKKLSLALLKRAHEDVHTLNENHPKKQKRIARYAISVANYGLSKLMLC